MCFNKLPPLPPPPPPPPPPPVFELRRGDAETEECLLAIDGVVRASSCQATETSVDRDASSSRWMADVAYGNYLAAITGPGDVHQFVKMDRHPDATNTTTPQFCIRGLVYMCGSTDPAKCLGTGKIHQGFLFNATDGTLRSTMCKSPRHQCLLAALGERASAGDCEEAVAGGWRKVRVA